jgi:hypothetical protein
MDKINWLQLLIGFFGGGAFGSLIKLFFDNRRNRIQPIEYLIVLKSVFNSRETNIADTQVTIKDEGHECKFTSLYTGTVEIVNTGLIDYHKFSFGLTLDNKGKFIQVWQKSTDRHHIAEFVNEPSLANQVDRFDIKLEPFNRKDRYEVNFLLTASGPYVSNKIIHIGTSSPVKLTPQKTIIEKSTPLLKLIIEAISYP